MLASVLRSALITVVLALYVGSYFTTSSIVYYGMYFLGSVMVLDFIIELERRRKKRKSKA